MNKERKFCFESLNEGIHEAMDENEKVLFIGEDILDPYGGAFKVAKGMSTAFPDRVLTTPVSEAAIVGIANGLALRGFIPIVEIMFGDFISLAFDQILNHLSKFRSMYNDQVDPHLLIRAPMGGYRGYGPTHSQSLEKFLIGIPNIKVLYPSHIHPLQKMIKFAINNDNGPVIFLESKLLYSTVNELPKDNRIGDYYVVTTSDYYPTITLSLNNFSEADVTLLTFGGMAPMVMEETVNLLLDHEIFCEIVILSQISPINNEPILNSISRTGKLITVEEGTLNACTGSELIASLIENGHQLLMKPPKRIAAQNDIIPSAKTLESRVLPSRNSIRDAVKSIVE